MKQRIVTESDKRVRTAVRTEMSIIADYMLDAILPEVRAAVAAENAPLIATDWIRGALVEGIDREALQAAVRKALGAAQQIEA